MKRFAATVLACMLAVLAFTAYAAEEAPDLEKVNVAWDLENRKPVTCMTKFAGLDGEYPVEYLVSGLRDTTGKDGTRQISFTISAALKQLPTQQEAEAILAAVPNGSIGGTMGWTLCDYNSGISVEGENSLGITVTETEKANNSKKYTIRGKGTVSVRTKVVYFVSVTCPADYDGLCVGVVGVSTADTNNREKAFWEGQKPFSETSFYSAENEGQSHFMRFRAPDAGR